LTAHVPLPGEEVYVFVSMEMGYIKLALINMYGNIHLIFNT